MSFYRSYQFSLKFQGNHQARRRQMRASTFGEHSYDSSGTQAESLSSGNGVRSYPKAFKKLCRLVERRRGEEQSKADSEMVGESKRRALMPSATTCSELGPAHRSDQAKGNEDPFQDEFQKLTSAWIGSMKRDSSS
jgi:hypothetical protein